MSKRRRRKLVMRQTDRQQKIDGQTGSGGEKQAGRQADAREVGGQVSRQAIRRTVRQIDR